MKPASWTSHFVVTPFSSSMRPKRMRDQTITDIGNRRLKRERYSYDENYSMARMLRLPVADLNAPEVRDAISDHAYRRVQIFYYQSLVYYKVGCHIERGKTLLQHGRSTFEWTSAAHSSILPNLKDQKNTISEDSHLYDAMNATVELPHCVNVYDTVIEGVLRGKALRILNRVSKEELHPYKGLTVFVEKMERFFVRSEKETVKKITCLKQIECLEQQLWFQEKNLTPTTVWDYLETMQKLRKVYHCYKTCKVYSLPMKLKRRLPWQRGFFENQNLNYSLLKKMIAKHPEWSPKPIDWAVKKLQDSLTILHLQRKSTVLPPFELLSGKVVDGKLVPMTEEELLQEKKRMSLLPLNGSGGF